MVRAGWEGTGRGVMRGPEVCASHPWLPSFLTPLRTLDSEYNSVCSSTSCQPLPCSVGLWGL